MTDARTVVLLHALGGSGAVWAPVAARMSARVLTPDLPGHGNAARLDGALSVERVSAYLDAFLDAERAPAVVLAGMSLGGTVAAHYAATRPDRVTGLVLASCVPVYPSPAMWQERAAAARDAGMAALVQPTLGAWFPPGTEVASPTRDAVARQVADTDPEGYAQACELLASIDVSASLPAIGVPCTVVCGDQDAPFIQAGAERIAEQVPGAVMRWYHGAGHGAALARPDEFATDVVDGSRDRSGDQ